MARNNGLKSTELIGQGLELDLQGLASRSECFLSNLCQNVSHFIIINSFDGTLSMAQNSKFYQVQVSFPEIDENVDLTCQPLQYLGGKIKALKKQEDDALVRLQTKEPAPPGLVSVVKKDLDVPAGAIKEELPFS